MQLNQKKAMVVKLNSYIIKMKNLKLFILLIFISSLKAQEIEIPDIYLQEFSYNTDFCYTNKKSDLIFFNKYYASDKIELGDIDYNDSIVINKLKNEKDRFTYFLRRIYSKDTIEGRYNPKKYTLLKEPNINDYEALRFKEIPLQETNFGCDEILYQNVVLLKTFYFTSAIVSSDKINKKMIIKLLKEDCRVIYEVPYPYRSLLFCEKNNFLALKYKDNFIFIFDKYLSH